MRTRTGLFILTALWAVLVFGGTLTAETAKEGPKSAAGVKAADGNVNYCVDCHRKMGNSPAIVDAWEKSVHGIKGNNCVLCHGGNETINDAKLAKLPKYGFIGKPGNRNISTFCGREDCHGTALSQFKKSPHYISVMKTGEPSCISCHGAHNVQRSSINIISDKTCSSCHPVEYSREIIASIFTIEKNLEELERDIDFLAAKKVAVEKSRADLAKTRSLFHQLVHVFSREEIQFNKKLLEMEIASMGEELTNKKNTVRRVDLVFIFTLVFSIITTLSVGSYTLWMLSRRKKSG